MASAAGAFLVRRVAAGCRGVGMAALAACQTAGARGRVVDRAAKVDHVAAAVAGALRPRVPAPEIRAGQRQVAGLGGFIFFDGCGGRLPPAARGPRSRDC